MVVYRPFGTHAHLFADQELWELRRPDVRRGKVLSIQVGAIAPLGPDRVPSGFLKYETTAPVLATPLGLEGDEQADLRVHGGPDKAIYCYPVEHYGRWREIAPKHTGALAPGAFGENLTLQNIGDEHGVCIGDIVAIGDALLQVTQPRQPCFKLGLRFDDPRMGRVMLQTGMTGWYCRVLEPGTLEASADVTLVDRLNPLWTIARFVDLVTHRRATAVELCELADLQGLAKEWRALADAACDAHPSAWDHGN